MRSRVGGWCKLDFRLILASNWGHDTGRGSFSVPSQAGRNVPTCLGRKSILYVIQRTGHCKDVSFILIKNQFIFYLDFIIINNIDVKLNIYIPNISPELILLGSTGLTDFGIRWV